MARQSYYEVLGLDAPPKDRREIKKAYSKQLKLTRPEEDPEGFMRLRDAHDQALNMLAYAAQEAAYVAEEEAVQAEAIPSVTFADMVDDDTQEEGPSAYATGRTQSLDAPAPDAEIESPTSYAIGATPSLDAPVQSRAEPPPPPLNQDILDILNTPAKRNDRGNWNQLFQKARALDIDDYVDFENLLLHRILEIHGFYDENNPHFDEPQKMPKLFSAPITASLFKTMSWDQVGKFNNHQAYRIEWLERRMGLRLNQPVQQPMDTSSESGGMSLQWLWGFLLIAFVFAKFVQFIANAA
ncbi:hypothetical protein [Litorimonas sp. WD9-15]|uniref:hypothetical protein n=1 Tax=Litorimonas sp. WD9-15 TaxID=3418716 RepID=UPI003D03D943